MALGDSEQSTRLLQRFAAALDACLPGAETDPPRLHQAMRYACDGGKRLRAQLVYAAGDGLGAAPARLDAAACAVELVHAYSLVHDDLPAMDDDDLRRGRPTLHRAYDEATAILAGDALLTLAFEVLATVPETPAALRLEAVRLLAVAAGAAGMVGGQAVDLESAGRTLTPARLESLHARKTGALILVTVQLAAVFAEAAPADRAALERYGRALGLAYQIQDDVLDETADTALLGKTQGKDRAQNKATFPALLGLENARQRADAVFDEARAALDDLIPEQARPLAAVLERIARRRH